MASMPARPLRHEPTTAPADREGDVAVRPDDRRASHDARVRAALDWALVEYADTLAKLAK